MIIDNLPSLTARYASEAFNFMLDERHLRHSSVWSTIFRDDKWATIATTLGFHPLLFGDDLYGLFDSPTQPAYIALLTGDKSGKLLPYREALLSSLKSHSRDEKNNISFHESRIILNVSAVLDSTFLTTLAPGRLFSYKSDSQLRSACLYWQDNEYMLRPVRSVDVVGRGGRASSLESVSFICGVHMPYPDETGLSQRQQFCFRHPECPIVYTLLPAGRLYDGRNIVGWMIDGE